MRTHSMFWRCSSLAMYWISFWLNMCQWMPATSPPVGLPPPVLMSMRISRGVFCSSYPKCVKTFSWAPKNFSGQWHRSQVSRDGRRFLTGDGIGCGYLWAMTE